jgi:hypothetical protein
VTAATTTKPSRPTNSCLTRSTPNNTATSSARSGSTPATCWETSAESSAYKRHRVGQLGRGKASPRLSTRRNVSGTSRFTTLKRTGQRYPRNAENDRAPGRAARADEAMTPQAPPT